MYVRSHPTMHPPTPRGSIFANFETAQLNAEERLFLHAARLGEVGVIKDLIESECSRVKVNCVDFMGRDALFLAIDNENVDTIELLLDKANWESVEEALLHAISRGSLYLVRLVVDHPTYRGGERQRQRRADQLDSFFRPEEKYQYPPEITPLMLAAHLNDHEIVQLFLSRGHTIEWPHAIDCQCDHCQVKQDSDSLKRSLSRLNAYRALSSPAFMSLSAADPITATFELRQEMKRVASVEKEFANEYLDLVDQCMDFACELMGLCRGTQEVEAILGEDTGGTYDPLARLRLAIQYEEKKFVAHPSCQQHLTSIWYGREMTFMQSWLWPQKIGLVILVIPLLPLLCLTYILCPTSKVARMLRCPMSRFLSHTASHLTFLFLLALATFGLEGLDHPKVGFVGGEGVLGSGNLSDTYPNLHQDCQSLQANLRPLRKTFSNVQILIVFWIIGLLWIECKQIYHYGCLQHFRQYYNFMDWALIALYLASYALRFVAHYRIKMADRDLNVSARAAEALAKNDVTIILGILEQAGQPEHSPHGYFIRASRFDWSPTDPEIVSDILFAVANVMSYARTTYVMPSHELLGPLQISLGRMLGDITRFVVLFLLVLLAFMVGMTNLYHYYGSYTLNGYDKSSASETFKGLPQTVHTLFFAIFGLVPLTSLKIQVPEGPPNETPAYSTSSYGMGQSTLLVDMIGLLLFAIYLVAVSIVLVNILIAMMSHSFEAIQGDNDVEWKFARTKLWMNYIDKCGTLPVPFNAIPTPKVGMKAVKALTRYLRRDKEGDLYYNGYISQRRKANRDLPDPEMVQSLVESRTSYSDIMMRLLRRYLFKMERSKSEEADGRACMVPPNLDDSDTDTTSLPTDSPHSPDTLLAPIAEQDSFDSVSPEGVTSQGAMSGDMTSDMTSQNDGEKILLSPAGSCRSGSSLRSPPVFLYPDKLQRRHSHCTTQHQPQPLEPNALGGMERSRSLETLHREITRRATLRRKGRHRGSSQRRGGSGSGSGSSLLSADKAAATARLEAIRRGQLVLDARLQDLQTSHTEDANIHDDLEKVKVILEKQDARMFRLADAIESLQKDIRDVNTALHNPACAGGLYVGPPEVTAKMTSGGKNRKEAKSLRLPAIRKSFRRQYSVKVPKTMSENSD